jgi:rhamnosyl/mannosyltransferase
VNILHIYKDYPPILGGIENHVRLLAEGQAARGHAVTALVTNPDGARTTVGVENGVRVIRAGRLATVASTPLSLALPWQLLRQRPDVVHLHFPYPVGEVSQWLLRRGRATVLTYHSDVVRQAGLLRFYRPLLARVLCFVDAIVLGSPPMHASAYLAGHQAKLHLIPYGIPLARFQATPPDADLARVRAHYLQNVSPTLPLSHSPLPPCPPAPPRPSAYPFSSAALLFVGRLRYYKGLDVLIRALPEIPACLLVVGIGPMEGEWRTLAREIGVADRVTWLGEVPDADLPALYHLADLFVLPASHPSEAFGLVQVEAMAAGLPVVCTELGTGTSYVNQDGVTGLVVPPRDPAALAAVVNRLLAAPDLRARMGAAARARVATEFALDVMVDRVLELYRTDSSSQRR